MARGQCAVCLFKGDGSIKDVEYCNCCKRNICQRCKHSRARLEAWWHSEGRSLTNLIRCLGRK